jgi:hypothetical protein
VKAAPLGMCDYYKESGIVISGPLNNTCTTSMAARYQGKSASKILPSPVMVGLLEPVEVIRLTSSWDEQYTAGG